jgi:hypothetical protein
MARPVLVGYLAINNVLITVSVNKTSERRESWMTTWLGLELLGELLVELLGQTPRSKKFSKKHK